ncbi:MAG: response regulator [Ilyomonas sp.]
MKYILIGEDDIDDQEILQEVFADIDSNCELKFITNGRKLISFLEALPHQELPCLIVLDYNMPELNGEEILRKLQNSKEFKNIPKILWSTSSVSANKTKCVELGASDFLVKPSTIEKLEEIARYMLSFCS